MRVSHVLDTCALLDLLADKWTNSVAVQELEKASHPVVLTLSAWEIARKLRIGKLSLPCDSEHLFSFLDKVMKHYQLGWFPLHANVACEAERLPMHHKDPVDRMILALSLGEKVPIFTSDRQFEEYGVPIVNQRG